MPGDSRITFDDDSRLKISLKCVQEAPGARLTRPLGTGRNYCPGRNGSVRASKKRTELWLSREPRPYSVRPVGGPGTPPSFSSTHRGFARFGRTIPCISWR